MNTGRNVNLNVLLPVRGLVEPASAALRLEGIVISRVVDALRQPAPREMLVLEMDGGLELVSIPRQ